MSKVQVIDIAPQLAWHFNAAGDFVRAAKYHALATDTACRRHAYDEALHHYNCAITACECCATDEPGLVALLQQVHETRQRIQDGLRA